MIYDYQRKIVNVVSLALDMHMPDFQEDKIACFIKTLVEKRLGPTWHVLVGRFVLACLSYAPVLDASTVLAPFACFLHLLQAC